MFCDQSVAERLLIIVFFVAERGEHFFSYGVLLDARMKQLKSAEAMYGRAIELAPQHVGALVNLGNLLASVRNDTEGAHALYARAHALEPQSAGILNNMALLLHRKALHAHSRFSLLVAEVLFRRSRGLVERCSSTARRSTRTAGLFY